MDWRSKRGRERVRPSTPLSVVRSINFFSPVKVAWCVIFQKSLDRFPRVFPLADETSVQSNATSEKIEAFRSEIHEKRTRYE